jgi:hypothetical protein
VPLLTGPDAGTNFGVVVALRLPPVLVFAVAVLAVLEAVEPPEVVEELLDDPHPASAARAAQIASAGMPRVICDATLA